MYRPQLRGLVVSVTVNEPLYSNLAACGRLATPPYFFQDNGSGIKAKIYSLITGWDPEHQRLLRIAN